MVYEDAEKLYAEVRKDCQAMLEGAICVLFPSCVTRQQDLGDGDAIVAYNSTFFPRREIIQVPKLGKLTNDPAIQTVSADCSYVAIECSAQGSVGQPCPVPADCTPASGPHHHYLSVSSSLDAISSKCIPMDQTISSSRTRTFSSQSRRVESPVFTTLILGLAFAFIFSSERWLNTNIVVNSSPKDRLEVCPYLKTIPIIGMRGVS
jgi:hypothetical protein